MAQHAKLAIEAARREEERQTSIQEEVVRSFAMAEEAVKLAAAQALAEAREQEHRMVVQAAYAFKAQQEKDRVREKASKETPSTLAHMEQVLLAAKDQNARLAAVLAHTLQVAQQTSDLEATRIAPVAEALAKATSEVTLAKSRNEALYHQL